MTTTTYEIYPLYLGDLPNHEKSSFTYQLNQGVKINIPFIAFILQGTNGKIILVDTGPCDEEWAKKYHMPIKIPEGMDIITVLEKMGIKPDDIDYIINTHLHWDHCFNNHLFPNKKIYVQEKELHYAINPLEIHRNTYESPQIGLIANWLKTANQFEIVDGDIEIDDGIELVLLPGHSDGLQGVLVNTTDGKYLLANDCINIYESWEGKGKLRHILGGLHSDLKAYVATYEKIEKLEREQGIKIIPGHDFKVLEHKTYPIKA